MHSHAPHNFQQPARIYNGDPTVMLQPHFEASVKTKLALPKVGTWSPLGLSELQSLIARVKTLHLKCSLYHWKGLEVQMSKMASHEPFGHQQHKLWLKEGPGVKLTI